MQRIQKAAKSFRDGFKAVVNGTVKFIGNTIDFFGDLVNRIEKSRFYNTVVDIIDSPALQVGGPILAVAAAAAAPWALAGILGTATVNGAVTVPALLIAYEAFEATVEVVDNVKGGIISTVNSITQEDAESVRGAMTDLFDLFRKDGQDVNQPTLTESEKKQKVAQLVKLEAEANFTQDKMRGMFSDPLNADKIAEMAEKWHEKLKIEEEEENEDDLVCYGTKDGFMCRKPKVVKKQQKVCYRRR